MTQRILKYGVEIVIPNPVAQKIQFPYTDVLRDKQLCAIEIHHEDYLSVSPSNRTIIADADFKRGFVTLSVNNRNIVDSTPFGDMLVPQQQGRLYLLNQIVIDFPQSYVWFGAAGTLAANQAIYFTFHYMDNC